MERKVFLLDESGKFTKEIKFEDLKPNDIFQLHDVEKVMNGNEDIIYKQDRLVADECGDNTFKATSYPYMEDGIMRVECISL